MKRHLETEEYSTSATKQTKKLKISSAINKVPEDTIIYTLSFLQPHEVWKIQATCKIFRKAWIDRQGIGHINPDNLSFSNTDWLQLRERHCNYLTQLHSFFEFKEVTLWLAIYISDIILDRTGIFHHDLPINFDLEVALFGTTALYIAAKFLEEEIGVQKITDNLSKQAYWNIILTMEKFSYNWLGCNIMPKQNIYSIFCKLLKVATRNISSAPLREKLTDLTMFTMEMYNSGLERQESLIFQLQINWKLFVAVCLFAAIKVLKKVETINERLRSYCQPVDHSDVSTLSLQNWRQEVIDVTGGFNKSDLEPYYEQIIDELVLPENSARKRKNIILKYQRKLTNVPQYVTSAMCWMNSGTID